MRWVFSVQPNEFKSSPQVLSAGLGMERVSNVRVIGASSAAGFRGGDSRVVVLVLVVVEIPMVVAWVLLVVVLMVVGVPMVAMVVPLVGEIPMVGEDEEGKDSNF